MPTTNSLSRASRLKIEKMLISSLPTALLYKVLMRGYLARFLTNQGRLLGWRRRGSHIKDYVYVAPSLRLLFELDKLSIEEGCNLADQVEIALWEKVTIGKNVFISSGVRLLTASHDINSVDFAGKRRPISIGDYAWIAQNAVIMPGVTIGEGAVVGAFAVVTKDVAPYTIVGGNPTKELGQRERVDFTYIPADWQLNKAWKQQIGIG